jgi:hypothetical protein
MGYILSNVSGGKNLESNIDIYNYASLMAKGSRQSWEDGGSFWQIRRVNGTYKIMEVYYSNGKTYLKEEGVDCGNI